MPPPEKLGRTIGVDEAGPGGGHDTVPRVIEPGFDGAWLRLGSRRPRP